MKYVFIEKHQAEFSIKAMCRVLRVARSGWYTWCQRRTRISTRQQFRQHCDSVVLAAFTRSKQRYGAPRLTDELRAQGYPFNVKTVAASLRRQGLRVRVEKAVPEDLRYCYLYRYDGRLSLEEDRETAFQENGKEGVRC